jgi:hypothetical protein
MIPISIACPGQGCGNCKPLTHIYFSIETFLFIGIDCANHSEITGGYPDAGIAGSSGNFVQFDGKNGYILTTQMSGVGKSASIMAWVNLSELARNANHFFYVAGESENGNDLDLQFETDNVQRSRG